MAGTDNAAISTTSIPECLIVDSEYPLSTDDLPTLYKSLEKAQSLGLTAVVKGIRGFNLTGFSHKVYAKPVSPEDTAPVQLRITFEYIGTPQPGRNADHVRAAYMDALKSSSLPEVEQVRVPKSGK
jgi:hypothetical protein